VLHVTSEYPPVHFGGLGTAVAGLTQALTEAGTDVAIVLVHGGGAYGLSSEYGYSSAYGACHGNSDGRRYDSVSRQNADRNPDESSGQTSPRSQIAGAEFLHLSYAQALSVAPLEEILRGTRLIHLHSSWLWPIAAAIRKVTGLPIIYTAHSIDLAEVQYGEWLPHGSIQDSALTGADLVIALSESERVCLGRHYPRQMARVRVVGNGIHPVPGLPVKHHRMPGASVLYVGRFGTRKGLHDVFEAAPLVFEEVPKARFVFVGGGCPDDGPGEARAWMPAHLCAYGGRMNFLGWQHPGSFAVSNYYAAADVLVVPSRYEPFGMVVLEGMLAGQAIVATNIGGPAELLEHERTALLYPPGDVDALASAIVRALRDYRLRRDLGAAARVEVLERWTWRRVLPEILEVYAEVTGHVLTNSSTVG
jgi:glycogen synthase